MFVFSSFPACCGGWQWGTCAWKTDCVAVLCLLANPFAFLSLSLHHKLVCEGLALSGDISDLLLWDRAELSRVQDCQDLNSRKAQQCGCFGGA